MQPKPVGVEVIRELRRNQNVAPIDPGKRNRARKLGGALAKLEHGKANGPLPRRAG